MKGKKFKAAYLLIIKGSGGGDGQPHITAQILRDKVLSSLQEMSILYHLKGVSFEEIDLATLKKFQEILNESERFEEFELGNTEEGKRKYS